MIVQAIDGETIARKIQRDDQFAGARARFSSDCAAALAMIHQLEPSTVDGLVDTDQVAFYTDVLDALGQPHPTFELVRNWLIANRSERTRTTIVHGDFRLGNLIVDDGGMRAVIDWELAHLGDPAEDLGWLCVRPWRFGRDHPAVGGLCTRSRLLELYRDAGGRPVSADQLRYWEIFGNWKWAVICLLQAASARAGSRPDVELAAIGRRVPAVEWELVDLLDREQTQ